MPSGANLRLDSHPGVPSTIVNGPDEMRLKVRELVRMGERGAEEVAEPEVHTRQLEMSACEIASRSARSLAQCQVRLGVRQRRRVLTQSNQRSRLGKRCLARILFRRRLRRNAVGSQ